MKLAIINGITSQDGYYLSKYLINDKNYKIIGLVKSFERLSTALTEVEKGVELQVWNMKNHRTLINILKKYRPCEIYNFASLSSGEGMYDNTISTCEISGSSVVKILEAIRFSNIKIKFCQASSREVFGFATSSPQDESTKYNPRSPYGAAKSYADFMINIYREKYNIFACSAILYNHESPRRSERFVTKKIISSAIRIKYNLQDKLFLGNLDDQRDWGFAGDYVEAMWLMLQNSAPKNYIISTGISYSVRQFCDITFRYFGLNYKDYVVEDSTLFRKAEPNILVGNSNAIKADLGWKSKTDLYTLIKIMIESELNIIKNQIKNVYKN
jgi:GDPmannose 4,6-dehydratase